MIDSETTGAHLSHDVIDCISHVSQLGPQENSDELEELMLWNVSILDDHGLIEPAMLNKVCLFLNLNLFSENQSCKVEAMKLIASLLRRTFSTEEHAD